MADLLIRIAGDYAAEEAFGKAAGDVKELGRALVEFAKESVEAFNQQEKADRQLALVAKESTQAFKDQASALQATLGVSDDMVERMQTMLLRFGEAPAAVDETVRALLDYSAATGTDAVSATQTLLSSVQSGRTAFKELGLQYEKTGEATKDLHNVTAALAGVVGGSAGAEADSLAGRTRKLSERWGEVKEAFGGFIAEIESKFGVLEKLAGLLNRIANVAQPSAWDRIGGGRMFMGTSEDRALLDIQELLDKSTGAAGALRAGPALSPAPSRTRPTGSGRGGGGSGVDVGTTGFDGLDVMGGGSVYGGDHGSFLETLVGQENLAQAHEDAKAAGEAVANDFIEGYRRGLRGEGEGVSSEAGIAGVTASTGFLQAQDDSTAKQWAQAGTMIGTQFAEGLLGALKELQKGGKLDAAQIIGNVVSGLFAVAGHIIGGYFGGPGGAAAGTAIGSLVGEAANMGIQEIGRASSAANRSTPGVNTGRSLGWEPVKKKHTGGWIDLPRFHEGGWFGADEELAVLQTGERVLARDEVARMGGPRGVDAAAKGGAGVTVMVSTMDGESARDFFERQGGRALLNALRTGRGSLPTILGEG